MPFADCDVDPEVIKKLARRYGCPIWVTRDCYLIPMTIMSPRHMQNAWRATKREIAHAKWAYSTIYSLPEDGMAFYFAEQEKDHWYADEYPRLLDLVRTLEKWMKKRKIPIPERY